MRGGLTIVVGVLTGNVLGVVRVALIAYLLGTHSYADSLAVAMGPLDTLNSVLINSIIFAFVPLLTAAQGAERTALFLKLTRGFVWVFSLISLSVMLAAPWLMRALAPGLDPQYYGTSVNLLRILALSTLSGGVAAVHCAMLYTHRRFGPAAFYQAVPSSSRVTCDEPHHHRLRLLPGGARSLRLRVLWQRLSPFDRIRPCRCSTISASP